jgi:phosphopantothenoylcysteine decarboxylase/phosphopantothenate--cysteine ligase
MAVAEVTPHDVGAPPGDPPFVVLGVSAGIAAYKAVDICRRLVDAGVHVAPVLTERATRFVGRATFDALGSEPTQMTVWDEASPIPHTRLGQRADLIVVAPATADLLARYAAGLADDLLTTTLIASAAPVVVCPAMHTEMWEHPTVRDNLARLESRGVTVVPPEDGRLAGGDVGSGRMAEPATIVTAVLGMLGRAGTGSDDLAGVRVVVSAGGTREAIDPVRFITNRSSGKQGHALAAAARRRGADVVLVTTSALARPPRVDVVEVETAAQMEEAVLARAAGADVVVMAAAVADFRPKVAVDTKLHKADGIPDLVLEATTDILAELGRRRAPAQVLVGFAAETDDVPGRARAKLVAKGVDLMVANDVSAPEVGFDHDTNAVTIFGADGTESTVPLTSKADVAEAVVDRIVLLLASRRT